MTDNKTGKTILVGGRILGFTPPKQGHLESMVRISRSIKSGTDDDSSEFWQKQVYRIGTLIESLIDEGDRELLDELMLTGKTNTNELLAAIFDALKEDEPVKAAGPAKKANAVRVRK